MAALPTHAAIQYPHAVWKPTKSPKARRADAYGPPVLGYRRPRVAKTRASRIAPVPVSTHPSSEIDPTPANDDGSRKTPDPTMFPTTSAVAIQKPSDRFSFGGSMALA